MFCDLFAFKKLGDVFANDGADVPGFDEYCWNELNNLVSKRSENTHTHCFQIEQAVHKLDAYTPVCGRQAKKCLQLLLSFFEDFE